MAAINAKKLLPQSKPPENTGGRETFTPNPFTIVKVSDITPNGEQPKKVRTSILFEVIRIRKKVIKLEKLINKNTKLYQKSEERKRKLLERQKFEKRENELEKKEPKSEKEISGPSLPKIGFLDRLKRFLLFTALGYAFNKFGKHIPKVLEFAKKLTPAFKFVEELTGNILNGVIDFIGAGYKAYDQVRGIAKSIGGENFEKTFDEFSKQFNIFANLAIIAGLAATGGTDFGLGRGKGGGKPSISSKGGALKPNQKLRDYLNRNNQVKKIEKIYGNDAARIYEGRRAQGASQKRALADVRKRFKPLSQRYGVQRGLAGGTGKGAIFSRGLGKAANRASLKVLGTAGTKIAKGIFGRVPIIGGLLDFAFALAMGEKPGRAAAKAVGATIGSALGAFIPIPFAGTILGGILGDIVGGALYDTFAGNTGVQKKSKGGQVTRGGKKVGGAIRRKIKKIRIRPPRLQPQKTIPGKDIGGKKEIEKLFPPSKDKSKKDPLGILEKTSKNLKEMPMLGGLMGALSGLMGASIDLVMGQKPEKSVFQRIGYGFGALIQNVIDSQSSQTIENIQKQIVGLAGGGVVPRTLSSNENIGMKIGEQISRTFEVMINSKVNESLQSIRRQLNLEGTTEPGTRPGSAPDGGAPLQFIEGMTTLTGIHKQAADIIAGYESATSGGYNAMNRGRGGDSPEGPMHYFGKNLTEMTISEVMNLQQKGKLNAAGRYQFVENTLPTAMRDAKLKPSDKFNELNQDKMFVAHLIKYGHRPWTGPWGLGKYTKSELKILDQAVKTPITQQTFAGGILSGSTTGVPLIETSQYGWRWGRMHKGIDLQAKSGWKDTVHMPVTIKKGGIVEFAGIFDDGNGSVIIRHPDGSKTRYLHLNNFKVRSGQKVNPGTVVGRIAGEGELGFGSSTGPHLHFEYINPKGEKIDPKNIYGSYVALGGKVVPSNTPLDPGTIDKPTLGEGLPKELQDVVKNANLKPIETPTSIPKSTPKGESYLVKNKMYFADFKNNTIKDRQGNEIDVSNGKNRWLLEEISKQRNASYKPKLKPTLSGTPQESLTPYEKGGKVHGLTRAILGEKGPEFVLDADTTAALEQNFPGFLSALNRAKYDDAISVLKNYTSYERENTPTIMIQRVIVEKPVPMPMGGGNASTSSIDSSMDSILQPLTVG